MDSNDPIITGNGLMRTADVNTNQANLSLNNIEFMGIIEKQKKNSMG